MSSSLQEQLVQAGLADEDSLKRSRRGGKDTSRRRKSGGGRKGGGQAGSGGGGGARARGARQPAAGRGQGAGGSAEGKKAAAEQPREPTAEEKADRLRQLVRSNRIDRAYAAVPYRFTHGTRIREIAVTGTQQGRLARGELAVVSDGQRCELVPAKVARRIRGIDREAVLVLNTGQETGAGDRDDPYADYRVPDDLMW